MVGILTGSLTQRVPLKASYDGILDPRYALKKYAALLERVKALRKLPDDPRIAAALLRLVHELLSRIYAHPNDDAPRLVYADWLLERGDVRGELITLQIRDARGEGSAKGTKRIRA